MLLCLCEGLPAAVQTLPLGAALLKTGVQRDGLGPGRTFETMQTRLGKSSHETDEPTVSALSHGTGNVREMWEEPSVSCTELIFLSDSAHFYLHVGFSRFASLH